MNVRRCRLLKCLVRKCYCSQISQFFQLKIFKNSKNFLEKLIKADDISFAYFKQTKMHKSIVYPLLDDYPGVFALKLDINVKAIKTNSNPTKYILAKLNDKNCKFNNIKT